MKGEILITDSLFIDDENISRLNSLGYSVTRLDKTQASESELCEALQNKVGYILGGIEKVTDKVIESVKNLEVISFTGSGYTEFIPSHKLVKEKGIKITTTRGAFSQAVTEFSLAYILMATRKVPLLTSKEGRFYTSRSISTTTVGIVGYGNVGSTLADMLNKLGYKILVSTLPSKMQIPDYVEQVSIEQLIKNSDIITLHVDKTSGAKVLSKKLIKKLKKGTSVINVAFPEAVDNYELIERVQAREIYAYFDAPPQGIDRESMPIGYYTASNYQTAFNTYESMKFENDMVTQSIINVLETGNNRYIV